MSYSYTFDIHLGPIYAGLTLAAQLVDTAGDDVGGEITTGFVEIGGGDYMLTATVPDNHQGGVLIYEDGTPGTVLAIGSINPPGSVSGSGAITYTYTLTSDVDGSPIAGADVWVTTDLAGTNTVASGVTDAFGQVVIYLDPGTYYFWRQLAGWTFTNPDTEVVS